MTKINYSNVIENDFESDFYNNLHKKIINYLVIKNNATFWEIVREVGGSDRRILRLLNQMKLSGEISLVKNKIFLKGKKKMSLKKVNFDKVRSLMKKIYAKKPTPTFLYDQRPVTMNTTVKRAEYLLQRGDLKNKTIAVIGDDDLTSLALGLTKNAKEIVVFDIDERLIKFINETAKKEKLKVTAYKLDLTTKIPNKFLEYFDVFLTDPTPNRECFSLFVSVGLSLLKKGKGFSGYVSFFPSHQGISTDFQEILNEKKVIITDMLPRFTDYEFIKETYKKEDLELLKQFDSGEERISFNENLTRFETIDETDKKVDELSKEEKEKLLGKATKRILSDVEKDPAFIRGDKEFVISVAKKMQEGNNEQIC